MAFLILYIGMFPLVQPVYMPIPQPFDPEPHWNEASGWPDRPCFWTRTDDGRNQFKRWCTDEEIKALSEGKPLP